MDFLPIAGPRKSGFVAARLQRPHGHLHSRGGLRDCACASIGGARGRSGARNGWVFRWKSSLPMENSSSFLLGIYPPLISHDYGKWMKMVR